MSASGRKRKSESGISSVLNVRFREKQTFAAPSNFYTVSRISQAEFTLFGFLGVKTTRIVRIKTSVFLGFAQRVAF